jgi:DHA2 family multidrug resistance protein
MVFFIVNELVVEKPLVRLRLLTQHSFGFGTISAVFLGSALFGSVYLLPAYLGQVKHYNAEQIGTVLAWTGLPQLVLIPLVPKLMQRFDIGYIAFAGMSPFALSALMGSTVTGLVRSVREEGRRAPKGNSVS